MIPVRIEEIGVGTVMGSGRTIEAVEHGASAVALKMDDSRQCTREYGHLMNVDTLVPFVPSRSFRVFVRPKDTTDFEPVNGGLCVGASHADALERYVEFGRWDPQWSSRCYVQLLGGSKLVAFDVKPRPVPAFTVSKA